MSEWNDNNDLTTAYLIQRRRSWSPVYQDCRPYPGLTHLNFPHTIALVIISWPQVFLETPTTSRSARMTCLRSLWKSGLNKIPTTVTFTRRQKTDDPSPVGQIYYCVLVESHLIYVRLTKRFRSKQKQTTYFSEMTQVVWSWLVSPVCLLCTQISCCGSTIRTEVCKHNRPAVAVAAAVPENVTNGRAGDLAIEITIFQVF